MVIAEKTVKLEAVRRLRANTMARAPTYTTHTHVRALLDTPEPIVKLTSTTVKILPVFTVYIYIWFVEMLNTKVFFNF